MRKRIERYFSDLTRTIYRSWPIVLALWVLATGYFGYQARGITIDTATESMLHPDDPSLLDYNRFRDQFGRAELVVLLVEAPDIFQREFLTRLRTLHLTLESEVPHLEKITSLVNVRHTRGEGEVLYVDKLLKEEAFEDLETVRARALSNPFYPNYVLSTDKKGVALVVETVARVSDTVATDSLAADMAAFDFETDALSEAGGSGSGHYITADEKAQVNAAIEGVMARFQSPDFKITFSGGSVVVDVFNKATAEDTIRLVRIMVLVIVVFLFLFFRRWSGIIIPSCIVGSAMISTVGLMATTGTPISIMTNILPAFIVSVGIADSVHVLAIFYREYQGGKSKADAICYALGHSGLPILMTSITTAAGLLSFTSAEIATIMQLGQFAAAGVMLAFGYTLFLLPALIAVFPIKPKRAAAVAERSRRMDSFLLWFSRVSGRHPKAIVGIWLVLGLVSIYAIFQLRFSNYILEYFPDNHPVKTDLEHVERHLGGSVTFEVVVDTKRENGIYDPAILKRIDELIPRIEAIHAEDFYVGKVISITDIVKETHQALHGNDKDYYAIPDDRATIAQELLLFESSRPEDVAKIADSRFRKTRITLKTKWSDSVIYDRFVEQLKEMFDNSLAGGAEVTITGLAALMGRTIPAALHSMAKSYLIAFAVISILMLLLVGDLKLGLLSMCPNLLPILMVMGLISLCGVSLDINTLFIGSVAIGLVVDDTIHFFYNFRKYLDETGNPVAAVRKTLLGTGRAMLITSIILTLNFFVLLSSTLNHSLKFGLFTGIVIIFALLADFLLAPAMLLMATQK
jgi:predicted RND superfamily exporter protein